MTAFNKKLTHTKSYFPSHRDRNTVHQNHHGRFQRLLFRLFWYSKNNVTLWNSQYIILIYNKILLTDTGEGSKLVHRRERPKVDTLFSSLFSGASERRVWLSAESKILASTFGRFRLYRLKFRIPQKLAEVFNFH